MMTRTVLLTISVVLLSFSTAGATSGIPDLDNSSWSHGLIDPAGILVCPLGDGTDLGSALSISGGLVDATITLTMLDSSNLPIANFPAEDMWIEVPGMSPCIGGSIADSATDYSGVTTFSNPLLMGGIQNGDLEMFINGSVVNHGESVEHTFLSPDLSGDHQINLTDTVMFSEHLGHNCP